MPKQPPPLASFLRRQEPRGARRGALAGGIVVQLDDFRKGRFGEVSQSGFAGEGAPQAADGVLHAPLLPGGAGIAEESLDAGGRANSVVVEGDGPHPDTRRARRTPSANPNPPSQCATLPPPRRPRWNSTQMPPLSSPRRPSPETSPRPDRRGPAPAADRPAPAGSPANDGRGPAGWHSWAGSPACGNRCASAPEPPSMAGDPHLLRFAGPRSPGNVDGQSHIALPW